MADSKEEYEEVMAASIEDFKVGRFVDFDVYETITWPDDSLYWDLESLIGWRKFWMPFLLGGLVGLVFSIVLLVFAIPSSSIFAQIMGAIMGYSIFAFAVSGFNLIRNEGRIEKLRRKIRTWEWQNGQAS